MHTTPNPTLKDCSTLELLTELEKRLRWKRAVSEPAATADMMEKLMTPFQETAVKLIKSRLAQSVSGRLSPKV